LRPNVSQIKKIEQKSPKDELRSNYDFSIGVQGKYAKRYAEGTNLILLEADVAKFSKTRTPLTPHFAG
jgi:hypothetical protein